MELLLGTVPYKGEKKKVYFLNDYEDRDDDNLYICFCTPNPFGNGVRWISNIDVNYKFKDDVFGLYHNIKYIPKLHYYENDHGDKKYYWIIEKQHLHKTTKEELDWFVKHYDTLGCRFDSKTIASFIYPYYEQSGGIVNLEDDKDTYIVHRTRYVPNSMNGTINRPHSLRYTDYKLEKLVETGVYRERVITLRRFNEGICRDTGHEVDPSINPNRYVEDENGRIHKKGWHTYHRLYLSRGSYRLYKLDRYHNKNNQYIFMLMNVEIYWLINKVYS